jgi:hypothetical protein
MMIMKSTLMHRFPMKVQDGSSELQIVDITVQEYFKSKKVELTMPYLSCLDVGKPKRPNYLPIEVASFYSRLLVCTIVQLSYFLFLSLYAF